MNSAIRILILRVAMHGFLTVSLPISLSHFPSETMAGDRHHRPFSKAISSPGVLGAPISTVMLFSKKSPAIPIGQHRKHVRIRWPLSAYVHSYVSQSWSAHCLPSFVPSATAPPPASLSLAEAAIGFDESQGPSKLHPFFADIRC